MEDEVAPLIESFAWGHFHRCHQLDELPVKVARESLVDGGKLLRDLISFIHITALKRSSFGAAESTSKPLIISKRIFSSPLIP